MTSHRILLVVLPLILLTACQPPEKPAQDPSDSNLSVDRTAKANTQEPLDDPEAPSQSDEPAVAVHPKTADVAHRVEELSGSVERDKDGNVTAIDLAKVEVTKDDIAMFALLPTLKQLKVDSESLTDDVLKPLEGLESLESLDLRGCVQLSNAGLKHVAALPNLKTLKVQTATATEASVSQISDDGVRHLKDLKLKSLQLLFADITDDALAALEEMTSLENLDLRGCERIGNGGLERLKNLTNLKALKLQTPSPTDAGIQHLGQMKNLRVLGLERTCISDKGLAILKNFPALEDFSLLECQMMTDAGLVHLSNVPKIRVLTLRGTAVEGGGLVHIKSPEVLEKLDMSETETNNDAMKHLAGCKNLRWLNLWRTQVNDEGLAHLKDCTKIKWLSLDNTRTTNEGLKIVAGFPDLEYLNLQQTDVNDKGLAQLEKLKNLKELNVCVTYATPEGVEMLKAALPECKIEQ